jgi:hypothetical protein
MTNSTGVQFFATRLDTVRPAGAETKNGPNNPGEAQYLPDTGGIKIPSGASLSEPVGIMNPYQTLNYIIRSGPPAFETIGA